MAYQDQLSDQEKREGLWTKWVGQQPRRGLPPLTGMGQPLSGKTAHSQGD